MVLEQFHNNYRLHNLLFDIMWTIFLSYQLFRSSAWYALSSNPVYNTITICVRYGCIIACVAIVVYNAVHRTYTLPAILVYIIIGLIVLISAYYSNSDYYIWFFVIFAAAYKQNAQRVVFLSLCITGLMLLVIIGCSQVGLAVDYIFDATTRGRHGLGFAWTTTPAIMFFFWSMGYIFLRREKMKFYEYLILEGVAAFFFYMTDTKLTFILTSGILVFMFIESLFKNRWRFWKHLKWFWVCFPVIICVLSLLVIILYRGDSFLWNKINTFIHNRLALGQKGIREYGITLFGQPIWWRGYYITVSEVKDYNYIDNSYLQIMLQYGLVFLVMTLAVYIKCMYEAIKKNHYYLVFILATTLAFSAMEPWLFVITINIFPLMAFLTLDNNQDPCKCNIITEGK